MEIIDFIQAFKTISTLGNQIAPNTNGLLLRPSQKKVVTGSWAISSGNAMVKVFSKLSRHTQSS
jgi:hypothetical protein